MIRLHRTFTPLCLRPDEVTRLTAEYMLKGSAVWNSADIKSALLLTSRGKCAYCECILAIESKYVEVEHFRNKGRHPTSVVEWDNLLPACKRCNAAKGSHDTVAEPMLNPYTDDPKEHLWFKLYRLRPATAIGATTIDVVDLNDIERLVQVRFEIGEAVQSGLALAQERLDVHERSPSTRTRNRLLAQMRSLLSECSPPAAYAATAATVLHGEGSYWELQDRLVNAGLWDERLAELDAQVAQCVLPTELQPAQ